jgi:two-component system, NtrC family, sensor kinase
MQTAAPPAPLAQRVELTHRGSSSRQHPAEPVGQARSKPHVSQTAFLRQEQLANHRILLVDDNTAIHEDFRKVLTPPKTLNPQLLEAEVALFGDAPPPAAAVNFQLHSAFQGQEALDKLRQAVAAGKPYALAFVDVRMPPGWDGIETVARLWAEDPDLQVVICTAYSDYSWDEMTAKLGLTNNLVLLKKPFDNVEVLQLAHALTRKWELNRQARLKLDELAQMVARRTAELEEANLALEREFQERLQLERQFRQAQKMDAIGQLAAGVAHDFNNILTVVHGHASMLLMRSGENDPQAKSAREIRNCADRAAGLVRQLLMFSRKRLMQFRNVALGEVVQSVSSMLRQVLGEHIALETECAPELPAVFADRGMIEQIIVNLTINARDAMPRGGRLEISLLALSLPSGHPSLSAEARPGDFVCLRVRDTGCGMDAEAQAHLFEPFFTTKEVGKGTGLGLATVYGIVKEHQGWIAVQSKPGAGATFQIFFPVSQKQPDPPAASQPETQDQLGTETILLAEDEDPLREMVAEILTEHGYRVLSARTGPAALELWQRESSRIDLLLTDMVMPGGMMGSDLVEQLKRTNPELKVIYTTGYSPGAVGTQSALQEGVNFLPKPYSPSRLAEIVRQCLDHKIVAAE